MVSHHRLLLSWPVGALAATPGAAERHALISRPADNFGRLPEQAQDLARQIWRDAPATAVTSVLFEPYLPGCAEHFASFLPARASRQRPAQFLLGCCTAQHADGRAPGAVCRLMGRITTSGVEHERTELQMDRGLAHRLRKAWPAAQGACSVEPAQVRCSAKPRVRSPGCRREF